MEMEIVDSMNIIANSNLIIDFHSIYDCSTKWVTNEFIKLS